MFIYLTFPMFLVGVNTDNEQASQRGCKYRQRDHIEMEETNKTHGTTSNERQKSPFWPLNQPGRNKTKKIEGEADQEKNAMDRTRNPGRVAVKERSCTDASKKAILC